ncbi:hypothetical protein D3C76_783410 [compost metagenome]
MTNTSSFGPPGAVIPDIKSPRKSPARCIKPVLDRCMTVPVGAAVRHLDLTRNETCTTAGAWMATASRSIAGQAELVNRFWTPV